VQGPDFQAKKNKTNFPVTVSETLTDLQILGYELHKNAFCDRAPPGPAGGAIALPQTRSLYKGEGREGRERKGLEIWKERKGKEGKSVKGVGRDGKGKGETGRGGRVRRRKNKGEGGSGRGREGRERGGGSICIFVQGPRVPSYATAHTTGGGA